MTSISVSGSGQREYHVRAGGGQYTEVGMQPKSGDDLSLQIGSVGKIEFAVSPTCLRIERRVPEGKDADEQDGYIVVVIESPNVTAINAVCRNRGQNDLTPVISARLQDDLGPQFLDSLETRETKTGAELYPGVTA